MQNDNAKSKIVFIAGPLSAESTEGMRENVRIAESYQQALAKCGVYSYCPHAHTHWRVESGQDISGDFYHDWHMAFLNAVCGAVVALPGWQNSKGSMMDVEEAKQKGMPLFEPASLDDLDTIVQWATS